MNKIIVIIVILMLGSVVSCVNSTKNNIYTQEQMDSIAKVKQDSIRVADSIAIRIEFVEDSLAKVAEVERNAIIEKLKNKFRYVEDEFGEVTWVYHKTTSRYRNRNSVHVYFMQDVWGRAQNLRFNVQYEDDDWLFIENMIFKIDDETTYFIPSEMKRDCGYGGRIWEWCDEPASNHPLLVSDIKSAKTVKIKMNGRQYYGIRQMSENQLKAFKETIQYYEALGGAY